MDAIPIEEAIVRPLMSWVIAAALPLITARALWALLVGTLPASDVGAQANALAPFRSAAFIVGIVQIQLAWMMGATALGPSWVSSATSGWNELFGAICAVTAFCAGGVGRLIEEPERGGAQVRSAIALRLRLVPFFGGPAIAVWVASRLPAVEWSAGASAAAAVAEVRWGIVALSLVVVALGTAFGGIALSVATRALVPATAEVRALAYEVAGREGVKLAAVLRLPTGVARFANAAALPWARTMVVTDRIVSLLSPSELRAVLAHEAGHLSEGWSVIGARLGTAIVLLFLLTTGVRVGGALHPEGATIVLIAGVMIAVPALIAVRRLARRMEERADAHARSSAGSASLADALVRIHEDARVPMVTGAKRVHPDLYDRLVACGRDPGPRPQPPRRRAGMVVGGIVSALLIGVLALAQMITTIELADVALTGPSAARWRLRFDPWDSHAMLAQAWATRRQEDLGMAEEQRLLAMRMGAPMPEAMELDAELMAARGDCAGARARFEEALAARAQRAFAEPWAPLELGGWHLPPTLVTECGYGDRD